MLIGRRQFVAFLGLAAVAPVSLARAAATSGVHGFIDESGKRGDWPLVVGLLTTSDPDRHDREIERLRHEHGYARSLRYASGDRRKTGLAEAVIDYWAASDDLAFTAVHASDDRNRWASIGDGKDAAYAAIYRRLLATATGDMRLHLKYRQENARDRRLRTFIEADLGIGTRTGHGDRPPENLTQLAGFLAGCVYGETTGIGHPLKASLIDRLRERIGTQTLAEAAKPRFSVTRVIV
jgi:hypothetical protein